MQTFQVAMADDYGHKTFIFSWARSEEDAIRKAKADPENIRYTRFQARIAKASAQGAGKR